MECKALRNLDYVNPVGWPNVDPTTINSINIATYTYERTSAETLVVDTNSEDLSFIETLGSNDSESSSYGLSVLAMRYQIDAYWENLTVLMNSFANQYMGSDGRILKSLSTQIEYDDAMSKILEIQGYISVISTIFAQIDQEQQEKGFAYNIIEQSKRNLIYSENEELVTNSETYSEVANLFQWLMAQCGLSTETAQSSYTYNSMTTTQAEEFIQKYGRWAANIQEQIQAQSNKNNAIFDYQGDFPRSVTSTDRSENIKQFQVDCYLIDSMLSDTVSRSVWVFLQIGNIKFSSWDNSNYIVDFDYKKNGSGCANSFTFNLAYTPPPGNTDINQLEKILSKRTVFFQYGYNEIRNVCSPQYQGQITQYSVSLDNNTLRYTIVGYSETAQSRMETFIWPAYGQWQNDTENATETDEEEETREKVVAFGIKATQYACQLFNTRLAKFGYEAVIDETVRDADEATVIDQVEGNVFECATAILAQAKISESLQQKLDALAEKKAQQTKNSGIDTTNAATEETAYFTYVIDDQENENGKKTITIIRALKLRELGTDDIVPSLAFAWGGEFNGKTNLLTDVGVSLSYNDTEQQAITKIYETLQKQYSKGTYRMLSNLIINFSTSYDGAVTISQAYVSASKQVRLNAAGELVSSYGIGSITSTGDTDIQDEKYSYWLWERNTMYSYDAELTMIGVPSDVPLGTYIYVKPIINGVEHHTAGYYYVTGSEDKVTSQGYTTTLKLLKVIDKDTDDVLAAISDLKTAVKTSKEDKKYAFKAAQVDQYDNGVYD